MECNNYNRKGHTGSFCKALAQSNTQTPRIGVSQACYRRDETRHYRRDFPKTKNNGGAGRVLAMGQKE